MDLTLSRPGTLPGPYLVPRPELEKKSQRNVAFLNRKTLVDDIALDIAFKMTAPK